MAFSRELTDTLHRSVALAHERRRGLVSLEQLLLAILDDKDATAALQGVGADITRIKPQLIDLVRTERRFPTSSNTVEFSAEAHRVITRAESRALDYSRVIDGADILLSLLSEKGTMAANALRRAGADIETVSSYIRKRDHAYANQPEEAFLKELELVEKHTRRSMEGAPQFVVRNNQLQYSPRKPQKPITERKAAAQERCDKLRELCAPRINEQPELAALADKYDEKLRALRADRGAYQLFLLGLEFETFLKIKAQAPIDPDRNLPLDADILTAVHGLIMSHAGLIALFPDAQQAAIDIDRYKQQTESIEMLSNRILDPVIKTLAATPSLLERRTASITTAIHDLNEQERISGLSPSQALAGANHLWLRGALGSLAQYLLKQTREVTKAVRDAVIKEGVAGTLRKRDQLSAAILAFLEKAEPLLQALARSFHGMFGWVSSLLSLMGLR